MNRPSRYRGTNGLGKKMSQDKNELDSRHVLCQLVKEEALYEKKVNRNPCGVGEPKGELV